MPGDQSAESGSLNIEQAVDRLAAATEEEDPEADNESNEAADPDETANPETEAEADESESDEGDPDEEGWDEDEEAEDDDDSDEPEVIGDESKVILDDGTETTVGELKKGSLRQADYTKKTQALAEERKATQETQRRLQEYSESILQKLKVADGLMQQMAPQPPDEGLREYDPVRYMLARQEYQDAMADYQARVESIRSGISETNDVRQEADIELQKQELEANREKLKEMLPELRDPEKSKAVVQEIVKTAQDLGFSQEEVASWRDPRIGYMAHLAAQAKRQAKELPKAKAKTKGKPKVAKPDSSVSSGARKRGQYGQAMRKLKKTGSAHDAVEALMKKHGIRDE